MWLAMPNLAWKLLICVARLYPQSPACLARHVLSIHQHPNFKADRAKPFQRLAFTWHFSLPPAPARIPNFQCYLHPHPPRLPALPTLHCACNLKPPYLAANSHPPTHLPATPNPPPACNPYPTPTPPGYSQTATMMALLEGGADPLLRDNKGQDVPLLIDGLRAKMPPVAAMLQRRMALEQVRGARACLPLVFLT